MIPDLIVVIFNLNFILKHSKKVSSRVQFLRTLNKKSMQLLKHSILSTNLPNKTIFFDYPN